MSQTERKSDAFVEAWQKSVRFLSNATGGSPVDELLRDHLRARANETAQAERIAALESEIARIKPSGLRPPEPYEPGGYYSRWTREGLDAPSGQVAEDERKVAAMLALFGDRRETEREEADAALSRLAAKAQGYESLRMMLAQNYGTDGDPLERVQNLLKSEEHATSEARVEQDERHRVELERDRESARAEEAEQERDAVAAANAALVIAAGRVVANPDRRTAMGNEAHERLAHLLRTMPHPGAALLEQHRKEVEALTARVAAMREHAQMLYECAPPTNARTTREQVEQWEKAKRLHHEIMGEADAGAMLLTEVNDHRHNIQVLRDELGAKDDETVVDAFYRMQDRMAALIRDSRITNDKAATTGADAVAAWDEAVRDIVEARDDEHVVDAVRRWQEEQDRIRKAMASEVEAVLGAMPRVVRVREGGGPENIMANLAVSVSALSSDLRSAFAKAAAVGADAAAAWDQKNGGVTAATARRGVAIARAIRALMETEPKP